MGVKTFKFKECTEGAFFHYLRVVVFSYIYIFIMYVCLYVCVLGCLYNVYVCSSFIVSSGLKIYVCMYVLYVPMCICIIYL